MSFIYFVQSQWRHRLWFNSKNASIRLSVDLSYSDPPGTGTINDFKNTCQKNACGCSKQTFSLKTDIWLHVKTKVTTKYCFLTFLISRFLKKWKVDIFSYTHLHLHLELHVGITSATYQLSAGHQKFVVSTREESCGWLGCILLLVVDLASHPTSFVARI